MKTPDHFFHQQDEPVKSCLMALRDIILRQHNDVTEAIRYGMPFYFLNGKRFCYLWVHKKNKWPYIGIVDGKKIDHPKLIAEKRTRMKILLIDPEKDIPLKTVREILKRALMRID